MVLKCLICSNIANCTCQSADAEFLLKQSHEIKKSVSPPVISLVQLSNFSSLDLTLGALLFCCKIAFACVHICHLFEKLNLMWIHYLRALSITRFYLKCLYWKVPFSTAKMSPNFELWGAEFGINISQKKTAIPFHMFMCFLTLATHQ
ncbi:hypothetical protein XENTR_v10000763 [Xenopus tropicalis]|nr:hypothetical protein XENTR_v10000763 [Xenopus tropicalis]